MATILLIEDGPGIGGQLPSLLATAGHRVLWCGGGPTPLAACPLLRQGRCRLADAAELLVFACPLDLPLRGRSYRGSDLLCAYRAHPDYGRLPLVLVTVGPPPDLPGTAPIELVDTFEDPAAVTAAIDRLLPSGSTASPIPPPNTTTCVGEHPIPSAAAGSSRQGVVAVSSSSRSLADTIPRTSPATTTRQVTHAEGQHHAGNLRQRRLQAHRGRLPGHVLAGKAFGQVRPVLGGGPGPHAG